MNPKTSTDLFNKIRSQFTNIRIGDENGAATADPASATFFEFEFKEDADTFGSVSVSLADGENMKVFYNRNLVDKIDEDSKDEWYAFLKELKDFAVEHQLRFDVRDITKSGLTKQDYQNIADTNKTVNTDEMSEELNRITKLAGVEVKEGLTGTAKRSYENLDKTRLIIRHTGKVDETVPGARSRQIQSLYIENEDGERFKYPITHLAGARAMTRHVANGGRPHDEFGQHIVSTSEDIAKLNSFSRYASNKDQLNDNAGDIIEKTKLKLENLRNYVKNLSKQSHYEEASKSFITSEEQILDDETVAKLREKFTMKNLDGRVEEALPLIHRIMSELEKPKDGEDEEEGTPNSTIPTDQVNELDPGDEPIDAPIEPAVDHAMVIKKFLADPDSKILLNKNMPDEKRIIPKNVGPADTQIMTKLSDIASRMLTKTPDEDRVANFASRVADQISQTGQPFDPKDPDASKNRELAKMLVAKYDRVAQEIDPAEFKSKKDIKGKAKETEAFENWVNDIDKVEEDKGSTLASRMIRKAGMDDPESMDAEVFKKSADMLDAGDLEEFGKYLYNQDTAPREFVMKKLADHDPETFKKVYGDQEGYLATMKPTGMEGMTFEDIKPYVSMYKGDDGKMVYDVLGRDEKSVYKTNNAKMAMKYFSKNFDKLKRPAKTEVEQEAEQIQSKVDAEDSELTRISQLANY
ncbi:MAG: hypothetical protein CBB94_16715 [Gammaproteobacteria bacterium TMED34]|nr:MAG: hypothetical protein CBB94_16715 [Gammaproteobacteria bacterium TMED34]